MKFYGLKKSPGYFLITHFILFTCVFIIMNFISDKILFVYKLVKCVLCNKTKIKINIHADFNLKKKLTSKIIMYIT